MADVKLTIAGRPYDVHCADGQETQLIQLASVVDEKVRTMPGGTEVRQLLFAALMLADEAQEARGKIEKAEPQSDSLRAAVALAESREAAARDELQAAVAREKAALKELETARQTPLSSSAPSNPSNDRALLQIADRIEALATKVEQLP
ncbi:cell division protein ZapA [Sphingopyxis sp. YR583]|uniref:cell division protein ZapA n=1 Tax=Sphingopyxis sp. YR583 TaxID=1881047 RepID=UPI0008A7D436|nr:cell division protein ZapA [Sphingopyxis sp. YR583]SEH18337.1 cell division protein ZapA [Sphingopyxis sp. YR583]